MKKTLIGLLILLVLCVPGFSQARTQHKIFTATGSDVALDLRGSGIYNHTLMWTGSGTRTSCSIKVEQSVLGGAGASWSDLIAAQNCASNGSATATGFANFVRITMSTLTGAGNTVYAIYDGKPPAASLGAVTVDTTGLATSAKQDSQTTLLAGGLPSALGAGGGLKIEPAVADAAEGSTPTNPAVPVAGIDGSGKSSTLRTDASHSLVVVPGNASPCWTDDTTSLPVAAHATATELIAGVSAKKIYVCSVLLVSTTAQTFSIIEGSGTTCGTNPAAVIGNSTAANGMAFAANGGFAMGSGLRAIAKTATAANALCLLSSGTDYISGVITYVQK